MKRILLGLLIAIIIVFTITNFVSAQSDNAGVLPDNLFYGFDVLGEKILLSLATNDNEITNLHLIFAQERFAEAQKMAEKEKNTFVEPLMNDYIKSLSLAQNQIGKTIINQSINEHSNLVEKLGDTSTMIDPNIESLLEEKTKEKLVSTQDAATISSFIMNNIDRETVIALAARGLGYNEIAMAISIANYLGYDIDDVVTLIEKNKDGVSGVLADYGIEPSSLVLRASDFKKEGLEKALELAKSNNNIEEINRIKDLIENTTLAETKIIDRLADYTLSSSSKETAEQLKKLVDQLQEKVKNGQIDKSKAIEEIEKIKQTTSNLLNEELSTSKNLIQKALEKTKSSINEQQLSDSITNELKKQIETELQKLTENLDVNVLFK